MSDYLWGIMYASTLMIAGFWMSLKKPKAKKEPKPEILTEILLIKTSDNKYRVKIVNGKQTEYIHSNDLDTDFKKRKFPEDIGIMRLKPTPYNSHYVLGTDFKEEDLPNLKEVMEYYKKYRTLDVVVMETVEQTIIPLTKNTISEEQLTVLELVPLLLAADKAGDKEAADTILDQLEVLIKL